MTSRLLSLSFLIGLMLVLSAGLASAERRVALIIGNSTYKNVQPLANPARDAAAVGAMFKKAGFEVVESKLDLGNTAMRRAIREFTGTAKNADIAVVYYAGHGIEFDGTNYLIPVDAELASDVDVEDETISLDRVMRMLDPVKRLRLVILDACRDNPFAKKMTRTVASRSMGRGLAKIEVMTTDTLVAFAAKAGMTAADGTGDHSPFTAALLDALATPGLDVRIAFGRVRDEVMKSTDNKQEPYVYGSIGGSTVALVSKPPEKQAPAAPAAAADTLARDYEFAERIGTRQAWDSFLAAHSTGFFADLARAARDKIIAAEQRVTMGKEKAAEEEIKRKAAEAARVRATEEAKLKAEADAKKAGEEEARRRAAEEARYRAAEEARLKAEEAARKFAEEEAKLKAKLEAVVKSQQTPTVVASAPSAPEATRALAPQMDEGDIARLLQFHLKRVGCDPGTVDGKWTDQSAHAMAEFNKRAKANFEVKVASLGALDAVKQQKARLCPLVCGKGFKARRRPVCCRSLQARFRAQQGHRRLRARNKIRDASAVTRRRQQRRGRSDILFGTRRVQTCAKKLQNSGCRSRRGNRGRNAKCGRPDGRLQLAAAVEARCCLLLLGLSLPNYSPTNQGILNALVNGQSHRFGVGGRCAVGLPA